MTASTRDVETRFIERLRAIRGARGWSSQELARRSGMTRVAISKIEVGQRRVSIDEAVALSGALGVPLDDMIRPGGFTVQATIAYEVLQ